LGRGNHGEGPKRLSERLLRTHSDIVLATDAHNLERCSGLTAGFEWVRDRIGARRSDETRTLMDGVLATLLSRV
jgi:hypothetical protein